MKKRIFALTFALALCIGLSACGGTPTDDSQANQSNTSTPSNNTPVESTPASGNSVTDDFLKTITAETAEYKGVCGDDATWYYQDNVLVIKGTGAIVGKPWGEDGKDICNQIHWVFIEEGITEVGGFGKCTALTKVVMPSTTEKIRGGAFIGCVSLENITIPDSVTTIERKAFESCTQLSTITIPSSVTYLGEGLFGGSCELESITFLGDAPEGTFKALTEDRSGSTISWKVFPKTVYYAGSGFDEMISNTDYSSNTNWVKQ